MVALTAVRTHNSTLKSLSPNLVAVFVGGTSGIGLSTAREFVRSTQSARIYLVGRNQTAATTLINELQTLNPSSQLSFIKSDASLIKSVDEACRQIKEKESEVNLLFMTAGHFTLSGRDETSEGLDRKFSLHYYARMRYLQNLMPLLTNAANSTDPNATLSRVVSVLDPKLGRAGAPNFSDLSLKDTFSLKNCATHASAMNNFALEHFSATHPETSFIHAYPSGVNTGIGRGLGPLWKPVFKVASATLFRPFMVDLGESGERHLFAATAPRYAPRARKESVEDVVKGGDDVVGSGSYQLNWDGEVLGDSAIGKKMREEGAEKKIWSHTEEVFSSIQESGKY